MKSEFVLAEELLNREYGKDHPAAGHHATLTFFTTTHGHRVRELAQLIVRVRAQARAEALEDVIKICEREACIATDQHQPPEVHRACIRCVNHIRALGNPEEER